MTRDADMRSGRNCCGTALESMGGRVLVWHAHVLARRGDSSSRYDESVGGIESQRTPESEARDESWRWGMRAGVEGMGVDDQSRTFSWQTIIGRMNDVAQGKCPWDIDDPSDCRHFQPGISKYEIFGASGLRTNRFHP